jgi:hypothetical protein
MQSREFYPYTGRTLAPSYPNKATNTLMIDIDVVTPHNMQVVEREPGLSTVILRTDLGEETTICDALKVFRSTRWVCWEVVISMRHSTSLPTWLRKDRYTECNYGIMHGTPNSKYQFDLGPRI